MARHSMFTPEMIYTIKSRVAAGEYHHLIAADYSCNQGRISEIKNNAPWVLKKLGLEQDPLG